MLYNYPHPNWQAEDIQFIQGLERDLEYYGRMCRRYTFHISFRKYFEEAHTNLTKLFLQAQIDYKENYAETYKPTP